MNKFSRVCIGAAATLTAFGTSAALAQNGGGRQRGMNPEQMLERIMQRDTNGDGKLSKDELPGPMAAQMFTAGDTNGDGYLDKAELKTMLSRRGGGSQATEGKKVQPGTPSRVKGPRRGLERKNTPAFEQGRRGLGEGMSAAGAAKKMEFEDYMKVAGKALHKLRRSPLDATSQKQDLQAIQAVQLGLINAKARIRTVKMAPQAKEQYGSDEKTYLHDFHMGLTRALMESFAMEMALLEGDTAKAKESLTYLRDIQKKGHNAFQEDEDDEAHEHGEDEAREHSEDEDHEHGNDGDDDDD